MKFDHKGYRIENERMEEWDVRASGTHLMPSRDGAVPSIAGMCIARLVGDHDSFRVLHLTSENRLPKGWYADSVSAAKAHAIDCQSIANEFARRAETWRAIANAPPSPPPAARG